MSLPAFCSSLENYQVYIEQELGRQNLPAANKEAIKTSFDLTQKIANNILEKGPIDFADFMQMALYEPALGYYASGNQKFGAGGDFVTAPEISPLFTQTFVRQFVEVFKQAEPQILEFGAGSGIFAADCLLELERLEQDISTYSILEISAELQARQKKTLQQKVPHLVHKVQWLTELPENFQGVIFANEVVDAIPCQRYRKSDKESDKKSDSGIEKAFVTVADQGFDWVWQPQDLNLSGLGLDDKLVDLWSTDYQFELRKQASAWLDSVMVSLQQGVIFLVDYGFPQAELYAPTRAQGSLQHYYRHHKTTSPLTLVGMQDITSSVDFTQLALAADQAKAQLLGFSSQSLFLMAAGIERLVQKPLAKKELAQQKMASQDASDTMQSAKMGQQLRQLLMPNEMGESCKVLAIGKQYQGTISGFSVDNQLYKL